MFQRLLSSIFWPICNVKSIMVNNNIIKLLDGADINMLIVRFICYNINIMNPKRWYSLLTGILDICVLNETSKKPV